MAETKAAPKPSPKQKELLQALTAGRRVAVIEKGGRKTARVETGKGKPVEGVKTDRATVEGCEKKGWLRQTGAGAEANGTAQTHYEITDEGVKARKAK